MAGKYEWLVIVPDVPGTLDKRVAIRDEHLKGVKPRVDAQLTTFGGAILEEHPAEGATGPPKMKGSAMVVVAESEKEVKEIIEADIYAKSGVWDAEKAQIWPFRTAVRGPQKP